MKDNELLLLSFRLIDAQASGELLLASESGPAAVLLEEILGHLMAAQKLIPELRLGTPPKPKSEGPVTIDFSEAKEKAIAP